jgi:hypothetical protein
MPRRRPRRRISVPTGRGRRARCCSKVARTLLAYTGAIATSHTETSGSFVAVAAAPELMVLPPRLLRGSARGAPVTAAARSTPEWTEHPDSRGCSVHSGVHSGRPRAAETTAPQITTPGAGRRSALGRQRSTTDSSARPPTSIRVWLEMDPSDPGRPNSEGNGRSRPPDPTDSHPPRGHRRRGARRPVFGRVGKPPPALSASPALRPCTVPRAALTQDYGASGEGQSFDAPTRRRADAPTRRRADEDGRRPGWL